jgi:hypothetical protein
MNKSPDDEPNEEMIAGRLFLVLLMMYVNESNE